LAMKRIKKSIYVTVLKAIRIQRRVLFHSTDKIEYDRIQHFFTGANVRTLPNVPRTIRDAPREKNKNELKLIFVSRIRGNKNLLYALEALSQCSCDVSFDIYGPIEDESYWQKCQSYIATLRENIQVAYKGVVSSDLVPDTFRNYHALLLPTETENFGHVIVEAMQAGVVPIISDQTPWRNLEKFHAGWDIDLKRPDLFSHAVTQLYEMEASTYHALSKSTSDFIQKQLNQDELEQAYINLFSPT
jgi:glycosyltransferase involved in cell wall biosynthesis